MRSTQGMHESQPITSFRRKWARVVRCGRLFPSPFTGAVHNRRHSGESRNPEGKGNPRHSRLQTTPSPHIINVIPAHLTRHPANHQRHPAHHQRHSRGRVLCTTSLTTDSRSDHVRLPVARPLWIPAFAGMTVVTHNTRTREPRENKPRRCSSLRGRNGCFYVSLDTRVRGYDGVDPAPHLFAMQQLTQAPPLLI